MSSRIRGIVAIAVLTVGCAAPASTVQPLPATPAPAGTADPATPPAPSVAATQKPIPVAELPRAEGTALTVGTHSWYLHRSGFDFPALNFTVSEEGWGNDGRFTHRGRPGSDEVQVAMQFWDVGKIYAHPCKWNGTLFDPGPTVDDLADALYKVPLRNASAPAPVVIDGYAGKYLEWSVPVDIGTGTTEQEIFKSCDKDGADHYFESWVGDPKGWDGDRYHQANGQIDRLWILDVDGVRFVIDAFSMPTATQAEIDSLVGVVESIRFER